jgi:dihydrofolate synthase / folylpolyglutamate synthase
VPYPEAIEYLYNLRWFGAKFGLDNTFKLAALAGNPQEKLRFIHVAGTNGKGSTCAMLESIYRAAGLRVGLFTSPHLVAFGERIQVNRQPISETEIVRLVEEMRGLIQQGWELRTQSEIDPSGHPTFFEVVTVMALRYFADQKCDLVIWETGLGGRLDATNIVTPLASVITNIQFDHQKWLGETLAGIAAEKAGIIKPGVPVITGAEEPNALEVIATKANEQNAPLTLVGADQTRQPPLGTLQLPLLGQHQRMNAAVALATVRTLADAVPASEDIIRTGLAHVNWPGRLQLIQRPSGQRILLDGAHNIGGVQTLVTALRQHFLAVRKSALPSPPTPLRASFILGILRDKDWQAMCELLAPLANHLLLVPVHSERTAEPHGLAEVCHRVNPQASVRECPSLKEALSATAQDEFLVIAGSLYLIGEAMELLGVSPGMAISERGLNEWSIHEETAPNRNRHFTP